MSDQHRERIRRQIGAWLRHKPEKAGISLTPEGWATIDSLADALVACGVPTTAHEVLCALHSDERSRFEVENGRARARYGHSIQLESGVHPGMPPSVLYYGCRERHLARALAEGLKPVKQQFVHLATGAAVARRSASRRGVEGKVLAVAAHRAYAAGVVFYPRGKGVWLSDPVPAEFVSLQGPSGPQAGGASPGGTGTGRRRVPRGGFVRKGPRSMRDRPEGTASD